MPQIGKILIMSGLVILLAGIIILSFGHKLKWFGNMPLDFNYENGSKRLYAPLGSMLLLSVILSIIANLFFKFFK
jgi:hypothetical protein|tara:strand:- start:192 stop:416 length:225 start_codon:yes stop_codon:yes gene_type:complete